MNSSPLNNATIHPVILAGAGPGDPDLLTVKAHKAIRTADVILHDALVDPRILALATTATLINVGKRCGHHTMKQHEINALLVREARTGARVLRLKGGDPMIFGRANEEIAALRQAGIALQIIPGITAATAAAASVQASLTVRGIARAVTFITGHGSDGTLPEQDWAALARLRSTLVFYMGARHASLIADRLIEAGLDPATSSVIVMNVSRPDEARRTGRLIDLADGIAAADLTAPALILIGTALEVTAQPARGVTCRVNVIG
ncbi:MAG: uroporphyrinogen-III C-methyltransferase [Acidiphilium sp.]|nr:uroporphyrinogen-III C-methyltransferase [Acidiphilium sp.]MDD4936702.1 uroporphyrinogen-III C-methyltransferase [Acidiphilium sp.]